MTIRVNHQGSGCSPFKHLPYLKPNWFKLNFTISISLALFLWHTFFKIIKKRYFNAFFVGTCPCIFPIMFMSTFFIGVSREYSQTRWRLYFIWFPNCICDESWVMYSFFGFETTELSEVTCKEIPWPCINSTFLFIFVTLCLFIFAIISQSNRSWGSE